MEKMENIKIFGQTLARFGLLLLFWKVFDFDQVLAESAQLKSNGSLTPMRLVPNMYWVDIQFVFPFSQGIQNVFSVLSILFAFGKITCSHSSLDFSDASV